MKIGINASFLRKIDTGIGQVTSNFLKELALEEEKKGNKNQFVLYLEEDVYFDFPANFVKRVLKNRFYHRDDLVRKIGWEKFILPQAAQEDGCEKFFSLYQSASIFRKIPHLMLVHDVIWKIFPQYKNNWRKKYYYFLVDRAIQRASRILTVSENSKKDIANFFGISPNKVVRSYIDCDPIFKKRATDREKKEILQRYNLKDKGYIFYVGGFDIRKNIGRLLEAFGLYCQKQKKKGRKALELVLAGNFNPFLVPLVTNIPQKKNEVERKYPESKGKIRFIGFVKQSELPLFYQGAAFFCYPSLYEGFGIPVLEALNSQIPVAASASTSIPEILGKRGGVFFDPKNIQEIAKALEVLSDKEELRSQLIEEGKK